MYLIPVRHVLQQERLSVSKILITIYASDSFAIANNGI